MTAVVIPMASPNPLKRAFKDANLHHSPSRTVENLERHTAISQLPTGTPQVQHEGQFSSHQTESFETVNRSIPNGTSAPILTSGAKSIPEMGSEPATKSKRRKFTSAEKEARRVRKEAKDRQRADEKLKFEESRRAKETEREESRRAREAEKEEKRKEREAQSSQKEEEKKKKEEEKSKKEKV